ncbi:MAG: hypothetical protein AAGK97_14670, partial [Bacteroidota bacterium]
AEAALGNIKKKGYRDAFIVSEAVAASTAYTTPVRSSNTYSSTTTSTKAVTKVTTTTPARSTTTSSSPATTTSSSTYNNTTSVDDFGNYKVRLAAYSDARNFDDSQVRNLGTIEHWRKKGWTIVVLSGFNSLSSAKMAKEKVANYGFKDAYIVVDEGGVLKKVK